MKKIIVSFLLLALVLTGCSSAADNTATTEATTEPVHKHVLAQHPQIVENPLNRTSETLEVTVTVDGQPYTFQGRHAMTMVNILTNLAYDPALVCDCEAECSADTPYGAGYQINLTLGFVRCEQGQVDLTMTHTKRIGEVINWVKSTGAVYENVQ